jgi:hypothetical protein
MADKKQLTQEEEWNEILAGVEQPESISISGPAKPLSGRRRQRPNRRIKRGNPNNWQLAQERCKRGIKAKGFTPGQGRYPGMSGNSRDRRRFRNIDDKTS